MGERSAPSTPKGLTRVCVVSPLRDAYSETFIRAHVERLPAAVEHVTEGGAAGYEHDGVALLRGTPVRRAVRFASRCALGISPARLRDRALASWLRSKRIRAVLAEYGTTGVDVMHACRSADAPLVVHFHGYDAYARHVLEGKGRQYPELFSQAAALVAPSHHMVAQLIGLCAPAEKVHYCPCGVDGGQFQGARPAETPPVFLAVGRFVDKKAPHLTLLAFSRAAAAVPEARLAMAGDGPLLEACRNLARALHLAGSVEFLGPLPHGAVAERMRRARAFVQHSLRPGDGNSEGMPVSVLEAMASGLPVVATRHAGIAEAVRDGRTGLLCDEGDVDAMAAHMVRLAREPDLAAAMGAAGRQRALAEYGMDRCIARLGGLIERAI